MGLKTLLRCHWCDTLFKPCGIDPDTMFAFSTSKTVVINDRTLGGFHLLCMIMIVFYIVFDLFVNQGYLILIPPRGTLRMSVMLPPFTPGDNTYPNCPSTQVTGPSRCCNDMNPNPEDRCPLAWPLTLIEMDTPYCNKDEDGNPNPQTNSSEYKKIMPCQYWDSRQFPVAHLGDSLLVSTRIQQGDITYPCYGNFTEGGLTIRTANLSCIKSDYPDKYPPPHQANEHFRGFVAGAEYATVLIEHNINLFGKYDMSRQNIEMDGQLKSCDGTVVKRMPKWDFEKDNRNIDIRKNRIFTLKSLMDIASGVGVDDNIRCGVYLDEPSLQEITGPKLARCRQEVMQISGSRPPSFPLPLLDCGATVRYDGMVLFVKIKYDNTDSDSGEVKDMAPWGEPTYEMSVEALDRSSSRVEESFGTGSSISYQRRTGVLLVTTISGQLGFYSFKAVLVHLTAGLGLLAVANVLTLLTAKKICPLITGSHKYKELIVQESPDFNEEDKESHQIKAKQSAQNGEFVKDEVGRARWKPDGKKVDIWWVKTKNHTITVWPNDEWFAYAPEDTSDTFPGSSMPGPEDDEDKKPGPEQVAPGPQPSEMVQKKEVPK